MNPLDIEKDLWHILFNHLAVDQCKKLLSTFQETPKVVIHMLTKFHKCRLELTEKGGLAGAIQRDEPKLVNFALTNWRALVEMDATVKKGLKGFLFGDNNQNRSCVQIFDASNHIILKKNKYCSYLCKNQSKIHKTIGDTMNMYKILVLRNAPKTIKHFKKKMSKQQLRWLINYAYRCKKIGVVKNLLHGQKINIIEVKRLIKIDSWSKTYLPLILKLSVPKMFKIMIMALTHGNFKAFEELLNCATLDDEHYQKIALNLIKVPSFDKSSLKGKNLVGTFNNKVPQFWEVLQTKCEIQQLDPDTYVRGFILYVNKYHIDGDAQRWTVIESMINLLKPTGDFYKNIVVDTVLNLSMIRISNRQDSLARHYRLMCLRDGSIGQIVRLYVELFTHNLDTTFIWLRGGNATPMGHLRNFIHRIKQELKIQTLKGLCRLNEPTPIGYIELFNWYIGALDHSDIALPYFNIIDLLYDAIILNDDD